MIAAEARIATEHANKYLAQLCKHFAHKVPANWADGVGDVEFGPGSCHMEASTGLLILQCRSETPEGLAKVTHIVGDHLTRFGWREDLAVEWAYTPPSTGLQPSPP